MPQLIWVYQKTEAWQPIRFRKEESDWQKLIVINSTTREIIGDTLKNLKFSSIAWFRNEGIYYSSSDSPKGSRLSAMTININYITINLAPGKRKTR